MLHLIGLEKVGGENPDEAKKITFFIYEEMNACRLACQRMGLGKEDVEKIFWSNSARIFGVK